MKGEKKKEQKITQQHNELYFTIISFLLMLSFTQFLIVFHLVFINIYEASNSFRMLRFFLVNDETRNFSPCFVFTSLREFFKGFINSLKKRTEKIELI